MVKRKNVYKSVWIDLKMINETCDSLLEYL